MKNINESVAATVKWGKKVGRKFVPAYTMEFDKDVTCQSKFNLEEAQEIYNASMLSDYVEILDGVCDNLFTLAQLIAMLEAAGFDVDGAYQAVLDNNNTKVFNSFFEACEAKEKLEERDDVEYFIETNYVEGIAYYVVVRSDGKVMKPHNFVPVDLTRFVPKSDVE